MRSSTTHLYIAILKFGVTPASLRHVAAGTCSTSDYALMGLQIQYFPISTQILTDRINKWAVADE